MKYAWNLFTYAIELSLLYFCHLEHFLREESEENNVEVQRLCTLVILSCLFTKFY